MTTPTRVASVQAEPVWLDMDATTDKTVGLIEEASRGGAQLVAFPETWIPGYPAFIFAFSPPQQIPFVARHHSNSPTIDGPQITRIRQAAKDNNIMVVVGLSEKSHGSLYMSQVIIGADGEVVLHRRKLKPTHVERAIFGESDGSSLQVVDTPLGRLGALNCWEHIQPLVKFAMYAQHEQIHVAGWPCFGIMGEVSNLSPETSVGASQTYALEGGSFVLVSSQIMSDEGADVFRAGGAEQFDAIYNGGGGYARIFGPDSSLLSTPLAPDEEGVVYADIDMSWIDLAKSFADPVGHYARPDVFQLTIDRRPKPSSTEIVAEQAPTRRFQSLEPSVAAELAEAGVSLTDPEPVPV